MSHVANDRCLYKVGRAAWVNQDMPHIEVTYFQGQNEGVAMWLQCPGGIYRWENDCPIYGVRPPPISPGRMELMRSCIDAARNNFCLFRLESYSSSDGPPLI